jgi:hypothetical protein
MPNQQCEPAVLNLARCLTWHLLGPVGGVDGLSGKQIQTRNPAYLNAPRELSSKVLVLIGSLLMAVTTASFAQDSSVAVPRLHTYFIAADEVTWDYTPRGRNLTGMPHLEGSDEESSASASRGHRSYLKAIFREYTDASFRSLKPRLPEWEHLGILGPLIRAEVGDSIQVFFKNNTKLTCSMHPHGLSYAKDSEGAMYNDGTQKVARKDDKVPPGGSYTYHWTVPERAGPADGDGSSILWMYHGHFIESKDMNTGLFGPIIVTAHGASKADGSPKDVDREFVTAFALFDETDSFFFGCKWPVFARRAPCGLRERGSQVVCLHPSDRAWPLCSTLGCG